MPVRIGEAGARAKVLGADQAHREIAVPEAEPRGVARVLERVHEVPGVAGDPESARVDPVREPVGDQVGVRRHVDAIDLDVVRGVCDHRELGGAHHVEHPARELRTAGAAREDRDHGGAAAVTTARRAAR